MTNQRAGKRLVRECSPLEFPLRRGDVKVRLVRSCKAQVMTERVIGKGRIPVRNWETGWRVLCSVNPSKTCRSAKLEVSHKEVRAELVDETKEACLPP